MRTLTQDQFDRLIEKWNGKNGRLGARARAANTCRDEGHVYAISPLADATGRPICVCTRCLKYVDQERAA